VIVLFLPAILSRNWQLKVLALATAVLLWTVPRFDAQSSQVLEDVPVVVQLTDPNWAIVGDPVPATVTVTLSGPARELIAIGVEAPPVLVPMDQVVSEDTTVLLRTSWFRGSGREGVVVEDIRPDGISLNFEPTRLRRLPFSPSIEGSLPQGISLAGPPTAEPWDAEAFGPSSRFQGVDSLRLLPIDLALVDGTGPLASSVDTSGLGNLSISPLQAMVTVPTEPTAVREFQDLTLILPVVDRDPQLQARPTSINVVLVGPQSLLEGVEAGDLRVTIPPNRAGLSPGQEERVLLIVEGIPEYVEARADPVFVLLRRPVGQ
jgi:YbbR domain-containing protein